MQTQVQAAANEIIIKPRFCEVDALNIVHHARYVPWLEEANFNFIEKVVGISKEELVDTDMFNPIKRLQIDYKNHITWEDCVRIKSFMRFNQFAMFSMVNEIECAYRPEKKFATAKVKMIITDKQLRLKVLAPDFFISKIRAAQEKYPAYFEQLQLV